MRVFIDTNLWGYQLDQRLVQVLIELGSMARRCLRLRLVAKR